MADDTYYSTFSYKYQIAPYPWNGVSHYRTANGSYQTWKFCKESGSQFTPHKVAVGEEPDHSTPIELILSNSTTTIAPDGETGPAAFDIYVNDPTAYIWFTMTTQGVPFFIPNSVSVNRNYLSDDKKRVQAFYGFGTNTYDVTEETNEDGTVTQTGEARDERYTTVIFDPNESGKATGYVPHYSVAPLAGEDGYTSFINIQVKFTGEGYLSAPSMMLLEKAIASIDVEYCIHNSKTDAPTSGWKTTLDEVPKGYYVWQRYKMTYVDGSTSYSEPVCITSAVRAGVESVTDIYTLWGYDDNKDNSSTWVEPALPTSLDAITHNVYSTSKLENPPNWSYVEPQWNSGSYIWTASVFTYEDGTWSVSGPYYARVVTEADEAAYAAKEEAEKLDASLTQQGIYQRLTNGGNNQGIFLDMTATPTTDTDKYGNTVNYYPIYINASMIRTGTFYVSEGDLSDAIFYASIDESEVRIAGFTVTDTSFYSNNRSSLVGFKKGVYIGAYEPDSTAEEKFDMGISVATSDKRFIMMRDTSIYGRDQSYENDETGNHTVGHLTFDKSNGGNWGAILAGRDYIAICTPTVYVGGYGGSSLYTAQSKSFTVMNSITSASLSTSNIFKVEAEYETVTFTEGVFSDSKLQSTSKATAQVIKSLTITPSDTVTASLSGKSTDVEFHKGFLAS